MHFLQPANATTTRTRLEPKWLRKLRNPIFGNVLIALYKEIYLILRSEKIVFIIKGFNLVLGFPNTKYPPNTKNYLPCLLLGGVVLG